MKNTFGENLKRLRIAKNYTQEQAAAGSEEVTGVEMLIYKQK